MQNPKIDITLNPAIASPEDDIPVTRGKRPASFVSVVASLAPGETASRVVDVDHWRRTNDESVRLSSIPEQIASWRDSLRNSTASSIRQAKQITGGTYSTEVCDLFTGSGRLFLVVLVTRTA